MQLLAYRRSSVFVILSVLTHLLDKVHEVQSNIKMKAAQKKKKPIQIKFTLSAILFSAPHACYEDDVLLIVSRQHHVSVFRGRVKSRNNGGGTLEEQDINFIRCD